MQEHVTRLSFNSHGWKEPMLRPVGEADSEYVEKYGYGNEDWFFRDEWMLGGWRYAFLQGVNKSRDRLLREGKAINVTLFTVEPTTGERFLVGRIEELECLTQEQAQDAAVAFRERGWLKQMRHEILEAGGDPNALGNGEFTDNIHNVRYRLEAATRLVELRPVMATDPLVTKKRSFTRYQLFKTPEASLQASRLLLKLERNVRQGTFGIADRSTLLQRREGGLIEVSLEHLKMQRILIEQLRSQFPSHDIIAEEDFIDVLVVSDHQLSIYEIKSDLNPIRVMRDALGQLLEYAFFRRRKAQEVELFIVGRGALSEDEARYFKFLQNHISLPLQYISISI